MKKTIVACTLVFNAMNSAFAQIPSSARGQVGLTCETGLGKIHLDLRNRTASIGVYCHAAGCSGRGLIKSQTSENLVDTFLLEMNMEGILNSQYMMVKIRPGGSGEIFNHPRATRIFNCIKN